MPLTKAELEAVMADMREQSLPVVEANPPHPDLPSGTAVFIGDIEDVLTRHLAPEADLNKCPKCGGPADNGHDRCVPPNPYYCSKCAGEAEEWEEWIEWEGGECPVNEGVLIQAELRDGDILEEIAMDLFWDKEGDIVDIIRYRVKK